MLKRIHILLICMTAILTACINESYDDCPSDYKVTLHVKDQYYSNETGNTNNSEHPFKHYIPNIRYALTNSSNNQYVIQPQHRGITETTQYPHININDIKEGVYEFIIWGNFTDLTIEKDSLAMIHERQQEGSDLYAASFSLHAIPQAQLNYSLGMRRVKGKLSIELINLPSNVNQINQTVSSVYSKVSPKLEYYGETEVNKQFLKNIQEPFGNLETLLAPTIHNSDSKLFLSFYEEGNDTPLMETTGIDIHIERNKITFLQLNYNTISGNIEVWILLDSQWELIYQLEII